MEYQFGDGSIKATGSKTKMNPTDLAIAAVAGVVGFGIIWGIFG